MLYFEKVILKEVFSGDHIYKINLLLIVISIACYTSQHILYFLDCPTSLSDNVVSLSDALGSLIVFKVEEGHLTSIFVVCMLMIMAMSIHPSFVKYNHQVLDQ